MIDVKDIMVGDWLRDEDGMNGRVDGVDYIETFSRERRFVALRYSLDMFRLSDPKMLNPIPITPAILEKNGWFYKNGFWTKKGPVRLSWKEDGTLIVGYFQFPCAVEFVHTLQNILRILGLEDIQI